jgi:hypothetical protein
MSIVLIMCVGLPYVGHALATKIAVKLGLRFSGIVFVTLAFGFEVLGFLLQVAVVLITFLQYPVHLYMVIALRIANHDRKYLTGDSENLWGFGQVVAIILVVPILRACTGAYVGEYFPC